MSRHVVLLDFTEKGMAHIRQSPTRARDFQAAAKEAGVEVELMLWTVGPHDGLLVLSGSEAAVTGLVLGLGKTGNVSTCTMRAFDADEFSGILEQSRVSLGRS